VRIRALVDSRGTEWSWRRKSSRLRRDGGVRVGLARGVFEGDWGLRDLVVGREGEQSPAASGAFPQVMYSSQHCTILVALPCFILAYLDVSTQDVMFDVIALPQEFTLAISIILLIIPCCYDWTVQGFSGNVDLKRVPEWWRYVAYVGGGCSLLASIYSFNQVEKSTTLWYSLYLDCGLVGGMVVWQVLGNYLG